MATISIPTTQNIELEYPIATLGDRIAATILDLVIQVGYIVALQYLLDGLNVYVEIEHWLLLALPAMCYSLLMEVFFNGQSVGKRILNIQVVQLQGKMAGISQYLLRWLLRPIDIFLLNGLIAIISISASKYSQRLGDLAAGTAVIKLNLVTEFGETIFAEIGEDYVQKFPGVAVLTDRDMTILKEVLDSGKKGADSQLLHRLAKRVKEVTGIETEMEDAAFLQAVLEDYNHIFGS